MAVMFVYVGVDSYLRDAGKLGFVITQTVFKTQGGGEGFRAFRFSDGGAFAVEQVDDLSEFQVFEGATNRTTVLCIQNSGQTVYPVRYTAWTPKDTKRLTQDTTLLDARKSADLKSMKARPSVADEPRSPWLTLAEEIPDSVLKVAGKSFYRARAGVYTGGANGVFWLASAKKIDEDLLVTNAGDIGKYKVPGQTGLVEKDLVWPLLRGRDIKRWKAMPSLNIVLPHNRSRPKEAIAETEFKLKFPKTYRFLNRFKAFLEKRPEYKRWGEKGPFYEVYRIGPYTFADHSVVWPEVGYTVTAAVIGRIPTEYSKDKSIIPDHTWISVPASSAEEAHFLAALLNSAPAQTVIRGYVVLHPSPHVLEHIAIPRFETKNKIHQALANLSLQAHHVRTSNEEKKLGQVEQQIDENAAELWGIAPKELEQIQKALKEA